GVRAGKLLAPSIRLKYPLSNRKRSTSIYSDVLMIGASNKSGLFVVRKLELKAMLNGWSFRADLLVITMTPFPALAPQMDAAAASFNMVMLSIWSGLKFAISPSYGKLSKIIRGFESEKILLFPLRSILIGMLELISYCVRSNRTAVDISSSLSRILVEIDLVNSALSINSNEPVERSFGTRSYPVFTYTSSNILLARTRYTLTVDPGG